MQDGPTDAAPTIVWFDCSAGASGDMLLGAFVDAGVPVEVIEETVQAVGVEPVRLEAEPTVRHGLAATRVYVHAPRTNVVRTWGEIKRLLSHDDLAPAVRNRAIDVFDRLARAEAQAHRTSPEQVHFHEVGALDAIADVVGTCAALAYLGVTDAVASPVALGSGMVRGEHGLLPVPPPAVLSLLSEVDAPVFAGSAPYEMCTPTGAALLAATASRWGDLPPMRITGSGSGAGSREVDEVPNVLRVVLGTPVLHSTDLPEPSDELLLEANVDDLDPRLWPPVLAQLLDAGASDAWLTPILMKKGRPAHTLSVLVPQNCRDMACRVVFTETSAIGLRETPVTKHALTRKEQVVTVDGQQVRVKMSSLHGAVVNVQPEYEDVVAAAAALGRPVKAVLAAATAAAHAAGLSS